MLKLVEVANYLTNQLNAIGSNHTPTYSFNIQAEVGANKNAADVQGILKTTKTELPPTTAGKNVVYNLSVELLIAAPTSNFNLKNVEEIVNLFVNSANGQEIDFSEGKGLITLSLGQAGQFKTEGGQGNVVPLTFNVRINYTEKIATSKSKHWFLQTSTDTQGNPVYTEIPYLTENVLLSKEGRTNKINTKKYDETFMIGQQKRYMFTLIYDEENAICTMLQKDILDGRPNTKYKLKYYDGKTYTSTNPYITTVSLFETSNTKSEKPNSATFEITFADVDDGESEIKYYMALVDNPFDEATENTRCFSDTVVDGVVTATAEENQHAWYNALVAEGADWDEIPAPNISSVFLTNQIYKNSRNYNLFNIVNKNYAIIRMVRTGIISHEDPITHQVTTETGVVEEKWLYYWTKNPSALAEGQVSFDLSMDTLQTYLFNPEIKFEGNMIQRASLNRWVDNGDGTISFDGTITSNLFERENLKQVAKRLVSRKRLNVDIDSSGNYYGRIDNNIQNAVACWCYVYLSAGTYKGYSNQANITLSNIKHSVGRIDHNTTTYDYINGATAVLCFPIARPYTAANHVYAGYPYLVNQGTINEHYETQEYEISGKALLGFIEKNGGLASVSSIKMSIKPPFPYAAYKELNYAGGYGDYYSANGLRLYINNSLSNDILDYNTTGLTPTSTDMPALAGVLRYIDFGDGAGGHAYMINVLKDTFEPIQFYMEDTTLFPSPLPKNTFNKTDVIGQIGTTPLKNSSFNPKLNGADYKELQLSIIGSSESYDIQKLNNKAPVFEYYEPLSSDITKGLVQYKASSNNEVYGTAYSASYNGLSFTNDLSLPIVNDQLDIYLANNKNAYLSFQNQQARQRASSGMNVLGGLAGTAANLAAGFATGGVSTALNVVGKGLSGSSSVSGSAGGLIGGIFDYFKVLKDQQYQSKQFELTLDDMRSAPDAIQNVNGSGLLAASVANLGVYAEIYEALPHELEMANDDMYMNGFTYNKVDDIFKFINKTGSKHIRRYFNYVQALIGNISGISMGSQAREDLRQRLVNGVRFWHVDTIDYEHENAEKWLSVVSQYTTFTTTAQYVGYMVYVANLGYTVVTVDNKDDLGIVPGTTIAYYKYIN